MSTVIDPNIYNANYFYPAFRIKVFFHQSIMDILAELVVVTYSVRWIVCHLPIKCTLVTVGANSTDH